MSAPVQMRTLTAQQRRAIEELLTGKNVSQVARKLRIRRATVSGWVNKSVQFRRALEEAQEQRRQTVISRLSAAGQDAVEALHQLVKDEASPRIRLMAAKAILTHLVAPAKAGGAAAAASGKTAPPSPLDDVTFTGEAEWKRWRELTQFSPTEREIMRQLYERLVDHSKKLAKELPPEAGFRVA